MILDFSDKGCGFMRTVKVFTSKGGSKIFSDAGGEFSKRFRKF